MAVIATFPLGSDEVVRLNVAVGAEEQVTLKVRAGSRGLRRDDRDRPSANVSVVWGFGSWRVCSLRFRAAILLCI